MNWTFSTDTDDLTHRFPEDTVVQFNCVPTIRAQLALNRNDSSTAIRALQTAVPYEVGSVPLSLYPVYLRGTAYLFGRRGAEAAAEFQKVLDYRSIVTNESIGALAHLRLGDAFALLGDTVKAKIAYEQFLTLWKDADPDIPVLQQARVEYAHLH